MQGVGVQLFLSLSRKIELNAANQPPATVAAGAGRAAFASLGEVTFKFYT